MKKIQNRNCSGDLDVLQAQMGQIYSALHHLYLLHKCDNDPECAVCGMRQQLGKPLNIR